MNQIAQWIGYTRAGKMEPSPCMRARAHLLWPDFNDLGRSVTPIFLLSDHFLYWLSTLSEKMKKFYRLNFFAKFTIYFFFFLVLRLFVRRFQMPLEGLRFVNNFYKIWLRSFASVYLPLMFLTVNPCKPCWITCVNSSKWGLFSACFISETKLVTPSLFLHFWKK